MPDIRAVCGITFSITLFWSTEWKREGEFYVGSFICDISVVIDISCDSYNGNVVIVFECGGKTKSIQESSVVGIVVKIGKKYTCKGLLI